MPSINEYIIEKNGLQGAKITDYVVPETDLMIAHPTFVPPVLNEVPVSLTTKAEQKSMLGTLVFSDLLLLDPNSDTQLYIDTVLFQVTMSKNIVTTSIQGRNGTVKEYISDGDYSISMKGGLVNSLGDVYPVESVRILIELMQLPTSLNVTCPFLQLFNIYQVVINSYDVPQHEGGGNTQLFTLECLSDEPIELIVDA